MAPLTSSPRRCCGLRQDHSWRCELCGFGRKSDALCPPSQCHAEQPPCPSDPLCSAGSPHPPASRDLSAPRRVQSVLLNEAFDWKVMKEDKNRKNKTQRSLECTLGWWVGTLCGAMQPWVPLSELETPRQGSGTCHSPHSPQGSILFPGNLTRLP